MTGKQNAPEIRFQGFTDPWEQRKFGSIAASFDYGLNAAATEYDGQNKYLRITDIDDATHEFLKSDLTTPLADLAMSADYLLEEGDLLFARTGASVGKTYLYRQYDGTVYFAGFLIRARIGESADPEFVYQATLTDAYKKYVAITSQRSGQPGVNAQEYADYQLMLPSRTEQQQIGMTLRSLDNLITLHQRKYDKLCTVKKSMLDKMFPKPGETEPEIRFEGFTDPWEQRKLGDVATIVGGGTPSTNNDAYWDGDIDWYSPAELGEQVYADRSVRRITQAGYDSCSATLLPAGKTILFTSRAGIGNTAILRRSACTNQGFQSLVVNDDTDVYFVYSMTDRIKKFAEQKASGSTFLEISGKGLAAGEFAFPSKDEQTAIGSMFKQLDDLITLHQRKCQYRGLYGYLSWEQRKLGELCTISKGHGYSKADIRDAGTPLILYGRLYTQYESRIENVDTFAVEQEGSLLSKGNEVIVPASGETAEDIAVASSVRRSGIIFGGDLNVVTPVSKLDPDYIALAITYSKAHDDLARRAQGKSVVHVHGNDIAEVEIPYPSESEQKRISTVVLGLDSLITLHQ